MKRPPHTDAALWDGWASRKHYDRPHLQRYYAIRARNLQWLADRSVAMLPAGSHPRILKTDLWNEAKKDEPFFAEADGMRVGMEVSEGICRIAKARQRSAMHIVAGSIDAIPFRDGAFDLVWDISTLDHHPSPALPVREYFRVLEPGGVLLLVTENPFCVSFPVTKLQAWTGFHVPFRAFLPARVTRYVRMAGFDVVDRFKTNVHLPTSIVYPLEDRGRLVSINRTPSPLWDLCKKYFVILARRPFPKPQEAR